MERSIIAPLSVIVPGRDPSAEAINAIKLLTGSPNDDVDLLVQSSLELYVRQMLSTNTLRLEMPVPLLPDALSPKCIKNLLAPSAAKRIEFVDSRSRTWLAVVKYLQPVFDDARGAPPLSETRRDPESNINELVSHVYLKRRHYFFQPPHRRSFTILFDFFSNTEHH